MANLNLIKCDVDGCETTEERGDLFPNGWKRISTGGRGDAKGYDLCPNHTKLLTRLLEGKIENEADESDEDVFDLVRYHACPSHCCPLHGCKYGYGGCPVHNDLVEPVYVFNNGCEQCENDRSEFDRQREDVQRPGDNMPGSDFIMDAARKPDDQTRDIAAKHGGCITCGSTLHRTIECDISF